MTYTFNEYRLKEINDFLATGIEEKNKEVAEILKKERDEILKVINQEL